MLRYAAGRNHARILNANFFLYSYHRPSPLTHYSTSETILTGPLSNGSSTRKGKKVYTSVHLTTRLGTSRLPEAKEQHRDQLFTHKLARTPVSFVCHITSLRLSLPAWLCLFP